MTDTDLQGDDDAQPVLSGFEVAAKGRALHDGTLVSTMLRQIEGWQSTGRAVGLIQQQMLCDQAYAIDLAVQQGRPTAITGGAKILLELLQGFHLVSDVPVAGDPWKQLEAAFHAADDGYVPG